MPDPHFNDEVLDQYSLGVLSPQLLGGVEEHLLTCENCQSRLDASDEFAMLFRAAAVQPDTRSPRGWRMLWNRPVANWTAAAVSMAAILLIVGLFRPVG